MTGHQFESAFYLQTHQKNARILRLVNPEQVLLFHRSGVESPLASQAMPHGNLSHFLQQFGAIHQLIQGRSIHVLHLTYEAGLELQGIPTAKFNPDMRMPRAVYLRFAKPEIVSPQKVNASQAGKVLVTPFEAPKRDWYDLAYEQGVRELQLGNCYQFNLTAPFKYSLQGSTSSHWGQSFYTVGEGRGAFAHFTALGEMGPVIYSNSPECLAQVVLEGPNARVRSMPIKGTINIDQKNWQALWNKLRRDPKNRGELSMITDLLANDLSRIDRPNARVLIDQAPLMVPGLMHQYSVIESRIKSTSSLWQLIQALFPGGSVTGAPKRSAMTLLDQLEPEERGFYCGSTLLFGRGMMAANINIRTAWVEEGQHSMRIGAGGGVTVSSNCGEEWQEMLAKCQSFLTFLLKTGQFQLQ